MSYHNKAALENIKSPAYNACLRYWQTVCGLIAKPRAIAFLTAFLSLSGLLGVAAPTLAQAQTASGLPLDANGWTVFTPSADTRIVYVSSSTGNDSTGTGDVNRPFKTIAMGLSLLRQGYPDWLLLKKGDAWTETNQLKTSGRSAVEPMLISSYGVGARPLINVATGAFGNAGFFTMGGGGGAAGGNNIAIVGIELYAYDRDPSSPNYNPATVASSLTGASFLTPFSWILIEDCKIGFFSDNLSMSGDLNPSPSSNVTLRRNEIVDSYGITTHSQGFLASGVTNVVLEENLFDHNGWNESVSGATATIFNHNLYLQRHNGPATIRGNIFSNDASGSQIRGGGTVTNNLWVHNPIPHNFAMPTAFASVVGDNVYLEGVDSPTTPPVGYGWGPAVSPAIEETYNNNIGTVTISNNIIAHSLSGGGFGILLGTGQTGNTVTGNIIYDWRSPIVDQGTGNTVSGNQLDASGTNNNSGGTAPAEPFPDPTRSVGSYYSTLGLGGTGLLKDFLSAARLQSKDNWNTALMAAAVNDYIRAGFGVGSTTPTPTPSPTPTADTTAPSVPTGLAVTAVSDTQVNLSWTASTDNVGVTGYKIFRNGMQVGTTSNTSYQNTGLAAGTAYSYTVAAYDAAGNTSTQSSSVSVTTSATTSASPPSVTVDSPTNGSTPNGSINIAVSASSPIGIASITITGDSNPLATCTNVTSCSATWQKKKVSKGTHTVGGIAVDRNGSPAKASVTVTILR